MSETPKRRKRKKAAAADTGSPEGAEPQREGSGEEQAPAADFTLRGWLAGEPLPRDMAFVFGVVLPAMMLAVNMWRVHSFTIDDSFISYRYARNLARGLGLVYNPGERIEGYTNFLFTVLLAGGIKVGIDPEALSKAIGAASAFGGLGLTYAISGRIMPYRTLPCVATWLLASTVVYSGWSVYGLETGFFLALILGGFYLLLLETGNYGHDDQPPSVTMGGDPPSPPPRAITFPWSGLVLALAGLTRPEAPLFFLLFTVFLGRDLWKRQNLIRYALFWGPVLAHLAFRRLYYGGWVPNTASAKTGNFEGQIQAGVAYVNNYVGHAGPVVYLALLGAGIGLARFRRDILAISLLALCWLAYVVVVGGDWMIFFRFMAPFEPLCFLLIDLGVRRAVDRRDLATNLALTAFSVFTISHRAASLRDAQFQFLQKEKRFWDRAAGGTAQWFVEHPPGEIALGDIGYVGWKTDYPILDLLGLVDPVISKLPGGYTLKIGPGFTDRIFEKKSRYVLLISANQDCQHPSVTGSKVIWADPRFRQQYELGGKVNLDDGFAWCFYQRKDP